MDTNIFVPALIRWVHILSAVTAVGGMIFVRLVLHPSAVAVLTEEQRKTLREQLMSRWRMLLHTCIGLLILTGVYNLIRALPHHQGQVLYHAIFGVKFLLAMTIFFIAIAVTGRSPAFVSFRKKAPSWLVINMIAAALLLLLSSILKNLPVTS